MDRVDLIQAALAALQPSALETTIIGNHDEARRIRARLLGALIRKRRLGAERSLGECAIFMGAEPQLIEAWEHGESEPSLPQLELLARFLNGREPLASGSRFEDRSTQEDYMLLRRRLIGALLRAARESRERPIEELSEAAGLEASQLANFEFGEEKIPVSTLTALAQALGIEVNYFASLPENLPEQPRLSSLLGRQEQVEEKTGADWREFAAESENLPFIRLAMAFQHIPRDDLGRIADALFAIIRAKGESKSQPGSPS